MDFYSKVVVDVYTFSVLALVYMRNVLQLHGKPVYMYLWASLVHSCSWLLLQLKGSTIFIQPVNKNQTSYILHSLIVTHE